MVIKGCFSEKEKRLNWYLKLFEEMFYGDQRLF